MELPIDGVLPEIGRALAESNALVLQAPPGAGKTTRAPLYLLEQPWLSGRRIVMLEPRRLAARAAARFMAAQLGESVGATVGHRMRMDTKVGPATRIEVVTEGVLTRMLQDDPELSDYGAILFDEFHERSLQADLGLALARECQQALRPDLRLLVMSATLDGEPVARLLGDAPVVTSRGRSYPVAMHYVPAGSGPVEADVARTVRQVLASEPGSVLVFFPVRVRSARSSGCSPTACPTMCCWPRYTAICPKPSRRPLSCPRRRAAGRWFWPPPSPRPVSPSRACA